MGGTIGVRTGTGGHVQFWLWMVCLRPVAMLGWQPHPLTHGIIHRLYPLSTIFCNLFDKNTTYFARLTDTICLLILTASRSFHRESGQVAQLVEHLTENQGVGGSTPSLAIIGSNNKGRPSRSPFMCLACFKLHLPSRIRLRSRAWADASRRSFWLPSCAWWCRRCWWWSSSRRCFVWSFWRVLSPTAR